MSDTASKSGSKMSRIKEWVSGVGVVRLVIGGVLLALFAIGLYIVIYRVFFAGQDVKKAEGTAIVADEQLSAEETITTDAFNQLEARRVEREWVGSIVNAGKGKVDEKWQGGQVEPGVDAAGRAALCELHDSFCGDAGPAPVQ